MPVSILSPTRPDQFFHIIGGLPTVLAQGLQVLLWAMRRNQTGARFLVATGRSGPANCA
ncbi:hypothetical protein [Rhodoferax ferrireducens]|uniref:hypothetical protein n=1 Tax=Rhodoferax ferrireducens TaxID=192843 RepID=UPI0002EBA331|nr:hypothetical protein [Rhodoferax ferrireducens]